MLNKDDILLNLIKALWDSFKNLKDNLIKINYNKINYNKINYNKINYNNNNYNNL